MIDGSVRLDVIFELSGKQGSINRADDSHRNRLTQAEGISDGQHGIADSVGASVSETARRVNSFPIF